MSNEIMFLLVLFLLTCVNVPLVLVMYLGGIEKRRREEALLAARRMRAARQ
jgi:hypothetical protein